ncbi:MULTISPECIES: GNAT family N-acetyltransferase [unclassified Nocardioides]|uniref:GNAT family N-acetyltransferase n=1 Tax=unclassified Nocardioides TaxID=2615069 RepID=UPI0009F11659|nr:MULTISPECIES: GNAT family N-acetyltransferase [unclassified Nocardioides]GAW51421.1 N-acetyltransferase GCN5 [Nocardioides sp. PD653-B2]GAW54146.1 N-acetyltransferase GCN5 [Nocardioides sp. PD653]
MTSTDLLLRPAVETDATAIAEVQIASRREATMPPGIHPDHEVHAWLTAKLAEDELWVAEVDGVVAGYARMTATWLDDLYVAPPYARRGVGSALLEVVKAQRPGGFCLWVFEMNTPARDFYARHGLVELEHTDGSANEEQAPDLRMAWPGEDPLAFLRGLIDEVDEHLGDLLARRAALTAAVQHIKHDTTRDPVRERAIAEAMALRAPALGAERLSRIVDAIITESLDATSPGGG